MQAQAYVAVCKTLVDRGRLEEAIEVLSKVVASQPQVSEARCLLGRCIASINQEAKDRRSRARQRQAVASIDQTTAVGMFCHKDCWLCQSLSLHPIGPCRCSMPDRSPAFLSNTLIQRGLQACIPNQMKHL
jgi:hypothetical protein